MDLKTKIFQMSGNIWKTKLFQNDWKTLQRLKYSKLIQSNHKDKNVPNGWKKSEMKIFQIYGEGNHRDENVPNDLKNHR